MKKILLLVLAGVGAAIAGKKMQEGREEQALWAEATDPITRN